MAIVRSRTFKSQTTDTPIVTARYATGVDAAGLADVEFFIADQQYIVAEMRSSIITIVGTLAGNLKRLSGTQAVSAGTTLGSLSIGGSNDNEPFVVSMTSLDMIDGTRTLDEGERLGFDITTAPSIGLGWVLEVDLLPWEKRRRTLQVV